jgi:predicted TIM-barrel fold metal-dependent hydrolase
MEMRTDWLGQVVEPILDPGREIVDPHHHFWVHDGATYELNALWADTGSGHNVVQTVFIECRSYYDLSAPDPMQSVGETAQVARMAEQAARHPEQAQVAGIVANADLRLPDLDRVLDAHVAAGSGRLVGIRHAGARDGDPDALIIPGRGDAGLYLDPAFQAGVRRLGARGLTYDTWHYHHQADDFLALARSAPETTLILDHFGTPLGVGRFAGKRSEIFPHWKEDMARLADCPNVIVKLGGFLMPDNGWDWYKCDRPPSSDQIVADQSDWYLHMIACFGPDRCMFESNFPVDRTAVSYPVLWNAFKKIAAPFDEVAKSNLFAGTARRIYGL